MTVPREMNVGVELLIKRMETHPEEFIAEHGFAYSKWASLISSYKEFLDDEDREALTNALAKLFQQKFTEKVLEGLVDPKVSEENRYSINRPNATLSGGTTPAVWANNATLSSSITANSLTLGKATLTDTNLAQLLAMKQQMELERAKATHKRDTLFGKLHNYLGNL